MKALEFRALWWDEKGQRWAEIPWSASGLQRCFPEVPEGDQRFVVCVMDAGATLNVIPHRYIIGKHGEIVRLVDGLSDQEREEHQRLSLELTPSKKAMARLKALDAKVGEQLELPQELASRLIRDLPGPPDSDTASGIWGYLRRAGGHVGTDTRQ